MVASGIAAVRDSFKNNLCNKGYLSDYLIYKLKALWNGHVQTEVNVHQI